MLFVLDILSSLDNTVQVICFIFMPPPFEEWWKRLIVLAMSIRPFLSVRRKRFAFKFFR